jgi:cytochrome c
MRPLPKIAALLVLIVPLACDAAPEAGAAGDRDRDRRAALSAFELEHGLGPFTSEVELGAIDADRAREGERIYQINCESCHRMDERLVGPPLRDILERRSPTFVLNMILNPDQMAREHPEVQRMVAEYYLIMPYQNISRDQALAILEYFRTLQP